MTEETIQKLNEVNKEFYTIVGPYFDSTRSYSWEGWEELASTLSSQDMKKVLDVGCGNGRFAQFLSEKQQCDFDYLGIDSNDFLLQKAKETYTSREFKNVDLLAQWPELGTFDLIVVFGVMHHIPSIDKRREFIQKCKSLLNRNGILCLSFWNFMDDDRISRKRAEWSEVGIHEDEVEHNDYLLTWDRGVRAIRYCHYFDEEEVNSLLHTSGLLELKRYKAEGKNSNLNTYLILKNESQKKLW